MLVLDPNSVRLGTQLFGMAHAVLSSLVYSFASPASLCPIWGWCSQLLSFLAPWCRAWHPVRIQNVCWGLWAFLCAWEPGHSLVWRCLLLQKVEGTEVNFWTLFKCPEVPGAPFHFCRGFANHSWKTWTFQTLLTCFSKFAVQSPSSVWLCDPTDCSMPDLPVPHCPKVCSGLCSLHQWCHPAISSSDALFSCSQSFPAPGTFLMHRLFALASLAACKSSGGLT